MADRQGTTKSGWCMAPAGMRPQHTWCRSELCTCECHHKEEEQ